MNRPTNHSDDRGPQESPSPSHEAIARRAYEISQERGFRGGDPLHDWLLAEAELKARAETAARAASGASPGTQPAAQPAPTPEEPVAPVAPVAVKPRRAGRTPAGVTDPAPVRPAARRNKATRPAQASAAAGRRRASKRP